MQYSFLTSNPGPKFCTKIFLNGDFIKNGHHFLKWSPKLLPFYITKYQETSILPLFFNVFCHAIHEFYVILEFVIIKFIFYAKSFKMAAVYKMAPETKAKIRKWHSFLIFQSIGHAVHEL